MTIPLHDLPKKCACARTFGYDGPVACICDPRYIAAEDSDIRCPECNHVVYPVHDDERALERLRQVAIETARGDQRLIDYVDALIERVRASR